MWANDDFTSDGNCQHGLENALDACRAEHAIAWTYYRSVALATGMPYADVPISLILVKDHRTHSLEYL